MSHSSAVLRPFYFHPLLVTILDFSIGPAFRFNSSDANKIVLSICTFQNDLQYFRRLLKFLMDLIQKWITHLTLS